MKIKNVKVWDSWVENNTDPYGKGVIDFCIRWANAMEKEISNGAALVDIAKRTSFEQAQGVTGFMYGVAVGVLSEVWEHGEDLRIWHNLDTQIMNEGEEANKSGGVLNPAMLRFNKK